MIRLDEAHMDHRAPLTFEVLVITFLAARGMAVDDVPLTAGHDNQVSPEITDAALAEAFRRYHADVARLDFVKAGVNLGHGARHRVKPCRITL